MKHVLTLALLVGTMAAMSALGASAEQPMMNTTFAVIGFVVLAAYGLAEIAGAIKLPAVTGYILAGIALGPQMANLVPED